jgi:NAD(P)-dependent dehydrogenase (short-subunit alcohol dehydrogenase family)
MNRMTGKICVVTGATQGLGAAIARRLAAAGAEGVVITGRNPDRGAHVARSIAEDHGIWTHFLQADFASVPDCAMVIAETERLFGRIDVLVNAGASTARGTILDTSPETFDALFSTNVRGPYFLMQAAIKLMIAKGIAGAICNIGSISALAGWLDVLRPRTRDSSSRWRPRLGSQGHGRPALRSTGRPERGGTRGQLPGVRRCRIDDRGHRELRPVGLGGRGGRNAGAGWPDDLAMTARRF